MHALHVYTMYVRIRIWKASVHIERLACYVLTQYNICFIYIILWLGIYYYQLITEGAELYLMALQLV